MTNEEQNYIPEEWSNKFIAKIPKLELDPFKRLEQTQERDARLREAVIDECIKELETEPCSSAAEEGMCTAMDLLTQLKQGGE